MKSRLGAMTLRGFAVSSVFCLITGVGLYSRFSFVKQPSSEDAAATREGALLNSCQELKARIESLEREVAKLKAANEASAHAQKPAYEQKK